MLGGNFFVGGGRNVGQLFFLVGGECWAEFFFLGGGRNVGRQFFSFGGRAVR